MGLKGLLVAGLMAALLSTVDGMLTASSALFAEDFYMRIIRRNAKPKELKTVVRIAEVLTILLTLALIPIISKADSVMGFIQDFYAYVFGVVIAIYLIGMFTKRVAPWSGFIAMITSVALTIVLDILTDVNFAYIGVFSFLITIVIFFALSLFEKQRKPVDLENLTIHTLTDTKGPLVGLKAWPALWKWALAVAVSWFAFSCFWQQLMKFLTTK